MSGVLFVVCGCTGNLSGDRMPASEDDSTHDGGYGDGAVSTLPDGGVFTDGGIFAPPEPSPNTYQQDKLFECTAASASSSPERIRRLTPPQFDTLFTPRQTGLPYSSNPQFAFSTHDRDVLMDQASAELLIDGALALARSDNVRKIGWPSCIRDRVDIPDDTCLRSWLEPFLRRAWQRNGTSDEVEELMAYTRDMFAAHGRDPGFEYVVARVYASPEFLFRQELAAPEADSLGRTRLDSWQTANAIVSALTDIPISRGYYLNNTWAVSRDANLLEPIDAIYAAAQDGSLTNEGEPEKYIRMLLEAPLTLHRKSDYAALPASIHRFFEEWLGHTEASYVFKSGGDTPKGEQPYIFYGPGAFPESINATIASIYTEKTKFLERLLTTRTFVINIGRDDHGWPYNLADGNDATLEGIELGPITLPEEERLGLLTHPGWLTAHSLNQPTDPHPVHRGRWIRENLLCDDIPQLPVGVEAKLPEIPNATVNARLHMATGPDVEAGYCWNCHQKMDPLGMPFEIYDHYGRYRTQEMVGDGSLVAVDTEATLVATGDPNLDGKTVNDAKEMIALLAQSERVEGCFVRQAFRYFMGRSETYDDACVLADMREAYRSSGGSFQEMLVTLLSHDAFLYRRVKEDGAP